MLVLRRPVILALVLCAGATSALAYRRYTAVDMGPLVANVVHGSLQHRPTIFGPGRGSIMRAGFFQIPRFNLSEVAAPSRPVNGGHSFSLLPTPASLVLTPTHETAAPMRDPGPPGLPIHDGMKRNAGEWPRVMRSGKADMQALAGGITVAAYMRPGTRYILTPSQGAPPMARLSRKLQPPETDEGLQRFQPIELTSILATRQAERLVPADVGEAIASLPAAALRLLPTRAVSELPVVLASLDPFPLNTVMGPEAANPANSGDTQAEAAINEEEGLTDAQKKSRLAGLPGFDDGKARPLVLPPVAYTKAQECLATAIYFEARSESREGQVAVAQVIINRVRSPFYPKNVCDVVYQGASNHRYGGCQFSFACDRQPDRIKEKEPWEQALVIAERVMDAKDWIPEVGNATHYHADYVRPRWVRDMTQKDRIGRHIFYRVKWWT